MKSAIRTLAGLGLAVTLLAGCSLTYPQPKRYALICGVAHYIMTVPPKTPPNLKFTDDDAVAMEAMFSGARFDEVRMRVRDDQGVDLGLGAPTKANLAADLSYFASKVGPNDLFVFYYSGHGTVSPVGNVDAEWILPLDSIAASGAFVPSAAISDTELGDMLAVLPTQRRVVILDSCNSGGLIGDGLEADTVAPALYGNTSLAGVVTPATIVQAIANYATFSTSNESGISPYHALTIAAAGADESSYEDDDQYPVGYLHGIMTYYLLQAPTSGDLNGDGLVTVLEMFALAKAGIDQSWNVSNLGTERVFSPHVSGGPIDLVLF